MSGPQEGRTEHPRIGDAAHAVDQDIIRRFDPDLDLLESFSAILPRLLAFKAHGNGGSNSTSWLHLLLSLGVAYEESGQSISARSCYLYMIEESKAVSASSFEYCGHSRLVELLELSGDPISALRHAKAALALIGHELDAKPHALEGSSESAEPIDSGDQEFALLQSKAKAELMAELSHDIRTPLNGIVGIASILMESDLKREQKEYVNLIRLSGDALLELVNNVLDNNKIASGKIELEVTEFDFATMCDDVAATLAPRAHEKGVDLHVLYANNFTHHFMGDPVRLRQILTNLIGNAVKFTDDGSIIVKVSSNPSDSHGSRVRVEITDTGIGIAPDDLDSIFETYVQSGVETSRLYGGSGLGLAICRKLVHLMNGNIGVVSQPNQGSSFWFEIPLTLCSKQSRTVTYQGGELRSIAVVSSSPLLHEIIDSHLLEMVARTYSAETIDHVHGADLVVLDGDSAIGHIEDQLTRLRSRAGNPHLPILVLSRIKGSNAKLGEILPNVQLILKPVRRNQIRESVGALLGLRSSHAGPERRGDRSALRGLKVLVAEDNPVNQMVAYALLERLGCSVTISDNGSNTLETLQKDKFDVLFMDCQMPVMDGLTATRQIRKTEGFQSHIPIIAMTANATSSDRAECIKAGMDGFLPKPIHEADVVAAIKRLRSQIG